MLIKLLVITFFFGSFQEIKYSLTQAILQTLNNQVQKKAMFFTVILKKIIS